MQIITNHLKKILTTAFLILTVAATNAAAADFTVTNTNDSGVVTVADSTFTGNSTTVSQYGGAILNGSGTMNITNSMFTNNTAAFSAGAVANSDVMSISGSTFTGNRATGPNSATGQGNGGAISSFGRLTIADSVITGNSATVHGGGIYDGTGQSYQQVVITNSTIVNNTATGDGGEIRASNSFGGNPTILRNTIVANNTANGGAGQDVLNPIASQGYNLIENTSGATVFGTTTGNIYGVDPLLAPLGFNGGTTRTHALRPGSPAIDAGDQTTFPPTDQRGITRPQEDTQSLL